MHQLMALIPRQIVRIIDYSVEILGKTAAWLAFMLVLLVCYNVLMRYAFNSSEVYLTELEWHVFSALFLLGAAYAFQKDRHVRVDVFYTRFSPKTKAVVNSLGTLIFLIPFCIIVIKTSADFAANSFSYQESSPDPAGLPARYLIKYVITFSFCLLLLQAVSVLIKSAYMLFNREEIGGKE